MLHTSKNCAEHTGYTVLSQGYFAQPEPEKPVEEEPKACTQDLEEAVLLWTRRWAEREDPGLAMLLHEDLTSIFIAAAGLAGL